MQLIIRTPLGNFESEEKEISEEEIEKIEYKIKQLLETSGTTFSMITKNNETILISTKMAKNSVFIFKL